MTFLLNSKLQNISALFFTIFRWISEFWDALFASRLKFSYSISFFSTFKKLKVSLFLHLFQITTMLGCYLYLKMAFKVEYFMQLTWSSSYQYLEIPRFCIKLENKLFKAYFLSNKISFNNFFTLSWMNLVFAWNFVK